MLAEVEDGAAPPKPPAATLAADFRSLGAPERSANAAASAEGALTPTGAFVAALGGVALPPLECSRANV